MTQHLVLRPAVFLLLSTILSGCGGGGGGTSGGGGSAQADEASTVDSGSPMTPGELSNAGDSTLTDGEPVVDAPVTEPADVVTPDAETPDTPPMDDAPSSAAGGVASIAGLWDDSFTYPDGRVNITYLEITADGRYINHDYRGDSFDLGENCYRAIEGLITAEAEGWYRSETVFGVSLFNAVVTDGQLQVAFLDETGAPDGQTTTLAGVTGLSTADFNEC